MKSNCVQSFMQMVSANVADKQSDHALVMAQACSRQVAVVSHTRTSIRPQAILEVVRRRGRSWGLLAQYEEGRLGVKR